jgi:hypothetical protein
VVDGGAAIERTFTLPELVELVGETHDPASTARARIAGAHARRPPGFRDRPLPEIRDPLGRSAAEQRQIARELEALVQDLAAALLD